MTATPNLREKAWASSRWTAYVREIEIDGRREWALFDGKGEIVHRSEYRSSPFFFAAEHSVKICSIH
jgi:hypothetical protein